MSVTPKVTLIAPDGTRHKLFETTGATTGTSGGVGNDLSSSNTYTFEDSSGNNWWTHVSSGNPVETVDARTMVSGGVGVPSPPAVTLLNTAFGARNSNVTWTLRFEDGWFGDTGNVTAATLRLVPTS